MNGYKIIIHEKVKKIKRFKEIKRMNILEQITYLERWSLKPGTTL